MFAIQHATIYTPQTQIHDGTLLVEGGHIVAVGSGNEVSLPDGILALDASGLLLVPGFIDLQINGAFGCDFTQLPATIWDVGAALPQYGVTAFLPTIITSLPEAVQQAQAVLQQGRPSGFSGALPLGLHLEGPFLNPSKKGAHNPEHLRSPSLAEIADWSLESHVRLVTLAPELAGTEALIRALEDRGVRVGAGHSNATYDQAVRALWAGIRYGTHLFNAMSALHHREPGLVAALLEDERVMVGLIPDGVHVHPALIRLVWQIAGPERLTLVTDAISALGMPPGTYQLGDQSVTVDESGARLLDGTLAGSILSMDAALRNLVAFTGCDLSQALATVTATPAAFLGIGERKGHIQPGCDADFVLLTQDLRVESTYSAGTLVYSAEQSL